MVFRVKGVLKRRILLLLLSTLALIFSPVYGAEAGFQNLPAMTYSNRLEALRSTNKELYLSRAHKGNAGAQHNLGLLLLDGSRNNESKARKWIEASASQEYPPALYSKGLLVINDRWSGLTLEEGRILLAKSAQFGYRPAHLSLANSLLSQSPVKKHIALEWLRKGARLKDNRCMALLGKLHDTDGAISTDFAKAYFWYTLAWFHRNNQVKSSIHRLASLLSEKDKFKVGFLLESHYQVPLEVIEYENGQIFPMSSSI